MRSASLTSAVLAAMLVLGTAGCSTRRAAEQTFQGNVVVDEVALSAPSLPAPTPDLQAGLGDAQTESRASAGSAAKKLGSIPSFVGLGSFARLAQVHVTTGEFVRKGDVLARFDDAMLAAQVRTAEADLAYARARSEALRSQRSDVRSAQNTIAANQAKLSDTVAQLRATRARLATQLASARGGLRQLLSARARLEKALAQLPPGGFPPGVPLPPGTPDPETLKAQLAQVNARIATVRSGISKLEAGIAKIDTGLAKAAAGRTKLASARSKAASARSKLSDAIELSDLAADVTSTSLRIARQQRAQAVLTSPVDGVVLSAPLVADVFAPGAAVFTIRPAGKSRVRAWLSVEQARPIALGDSASVDADWLAAGSSSGKVTLLGAETGFPPTSLSTSVIHLVRGVPIEVTLDEASDFPPGTPVDLTFERK